MKMLRITTKALFALLLLLCLVTGCNRQPPDAEHTGAAGDPAQAYLTITGDGVARETQYSLADLKNMADALAESSYSTVNNWPTKKFYVAKGVAVRQLLERAGLKEEAQTVSFLAADGYKTTLTRAQLTETRYCYPGLLQDSREGAVEAPLLLAWEYQEDTSDLTAATAGKLRLFVGQLGLNDMVTAAFVKNVVTIEVLTAAAGQWDPVEAATAPGPVERGAAVELNHPTIDLVRIYYTTDGSPPDPYNGIVYNPSATYFRPELNKPVVITENLTIKAYATGFGKADSPITEFTYQVR